MSILAHLAELRRRLVKAAIGFVAAAVVGWFLFDPVFEALQQPVIDLAARSEGAITVNFAGLASALDMRIKISAFVGVILSSPWWLYQLWAFIAPGLKRKEKRYTVGFVAVAAPLFLGGVALGWWVFPRAVWILVGFTPEGSANILDAQLYLGFAMRVLLAFGIAFVFPVAMVVLSWLGVVKPRTWLHGWRWAVLSLLIFAAIITPTPDIATMLALGGPMIVLYFGAIGIGALGGRAKRKQAS